MRRTALSERSVRRAEGVTLLLLAVLTVAPAQPPSQLTPVREVADGISLFHLTDPALVDPEAPISAWLLRLDPARVTLRAALANDEVMGTETVAGTAARHGALAAINAGFFLPNGDPSGLYKKSGRLISDTRRPRGAIGISSANGRVRLLFDRLTATMSLTIHRSLGRKTVVPIDGIDTTRLRGRLMLFTPAYHEHTDTAPGGLEWPVAGRPLRVTAAPSETGRTPIPPDGFVLSFGGRSPPASLRGLKRGSRLDLETSYVPLSSEDDEWAAAGDIIGGAGLLAQGGRYIEDWTVERFGPGFAETRHPRTMIGVAEDGSIWLAAVDGRQPALSAGMTLAELQALARKLQLTDALNLDGGGSTTMWVKGEIVNSPSDAAGPRKVSDALLVFPLTH
jgi:hypothetical protein